jgi:hypothetical protein
MKYRIAKLKNGRYELHKKINWFQWAWIDSSNSYEEIKKQMEWIIKDKTRREENEKGEKLDKIIEEFEV